MHQRGTRNVHRDMSSGAIIDRVRDGWLAWAVVIGFAACGPAVDGVGGDGSTAGDGAPAGSRGSTDGGSGMSAGSADPADDATGADPTGAGVVGEPDVRRETDCNLWTDDCPRGEKCMPWADDGGGVWNSTRCVPIAPDPRQPGERCTVEESPSSGIDDCAAHSLCWFVDPATNVGVCIAMCSGTEANPTCESECTLCNQLRGGPGRDREQVHAGVRFAHLPACGLGHPSPLARRVRAA